ncbi:putative C6 transcription factor [Aspergillus pseudonomiae]|uniref:Fungal specific transcription factor n=1 Tax=Aspergillus nomiae NRRL (strain ATCC 15546 / NRRL 13137 / CBS 260.88 / M93) TaxID=1509407 RepID=A0A0L1IWU3_ASPN3|nr:fungal specific transcription factor [Aspergillus nomiae NRRL 13137]KAB8259189.1 putative C6 transcription factor [Aspergillus pseudonomiae]KNG84021.1 fungal specific transcription factor [Aspergillus nomiae NRRL 13137]
MKRSSSDAGLVSPRREDRHPSTVPDGRPPPPKISKARACAECKRHKIRCEFKSGETSCNKCIRSGIKCVVNDFSQKFVDDDGIWKSQAAATIQQLQAAVSHLLRHDGLPELSSYATGDTQNGPSPVASHHEHRSSLDGSQSISNHTSQHGPGVIMDVTREPSQEPDLQDRELVPAPMRSLYEVTKLRNLRSNLIEQPKLTLLEEDFISRGVLSIHEAEELFAYFSRTMNQLLWGGIILVHRDLTSVRRASTLLSAAVLTVAALHIPNRTETLNRCYHEYVSLVSSMSLTRAHTLDDVRGLCVGAFWLSELSWKLSGHAVRIATELGLHQSYQKMIRGHSDQYERAQLWYLLYVCDHHFSIAYGRPPVIHEDAAIKNYETFLQSPMVVPGDIRLLAQVALFMILTEAYRMFGSDTEQALTEEDFGQLRVYNVAVDQWRLLWQPRSADSPYVRTYPSKGVVLHYHFAKFQLNSLSLRALSPSNTPVFSMDRKESANIAISSAMACLNMVLEEPDIRDAIVGVPIFTHTMVTFSAVFLLKVAVNWNSAYLSLDGREVRRLVERVIELLNCVSAGERHLTRHIARGLGKMLDRFDSWETAWQGGPPVGGPADRSSSEVPGGANAMAQGFPPPDLIYDMVGTYGFGLDENLLDPSMANFEFLAH